MITKTKIQSALWVKKAAAIVAVAALSATTLGGAYAATTKIGDATVTGNATLNQDIMFDDATNKATASVSGIKVTASILPTLNMSISADTIALGDLTAGTESAGTVNLEIGTNAPNWVKITARSQKGWLENTTNAGTFIGAETTDGNPESYKFSSTHTVDSTITGFTSNGDLTATEVVDNTTEHQVYLTNKPEIVNWVDDLTFQVAATSNAQSTFGDYEDTITFTVTGNF